MTQGSPRGGGGVGGVEHEDAVQPVVTGIGIVSPIGIGRESFWSALCAGRSGFSPIDNFAVPPHAPRLAAQIREFEARDFIRSPQLRRMDKLSRLLAGAARMAIDDAGLNGDDCPRERVAVVLGSAVGNMSESVLYLERVFKRGPSSASPMMFPNLVMNAPASYVAIEIGATGVNLTFSQGDVSGEQAIMFGSDLIRSGRADVVLAGGGDELGAIVYEVYRRARALSSQRGGEEWSSPYDVHRNGVVLGEGAAVLVIESAARARQRGARARARLEGHVDFGVPAPAYDWPKSALPALVPLRHLLATGRHEAIDLVCGSANSSRRLDHCELDLLSRLFGEAAPQVHLASIKGAVGEFGTVGALTAAAGCLALSEQTVPPLGQLRDPEPEAAFRFERRAQKRALERVLVCGMSRGGAGAAILLGRAES